MYKNKYKTKATKSFYELNISKFQSFKRLHNRADYEGSGIGLAIVKLCVDKLGGKVEL